MLEDEGNIFQNTDTVLEYQHNTYNKIENNRIKITEWDILTIYLTGNMLTGLR